MYRQNAVSSKSVEATQMYPLTFSAPNSHVQVVCLFDAPVEDKSINSIHTMSESNYHSSVVEANNQIQHPSVTPVPNLYSIDASAFITIENTRKSKHLSRSSKGPKRPSRPLSPSPKSKEEIWQDVQSAIKRNEESIDDIKQWIAHSLPSFEDDPDSEPTYVDYGGNPSQETPKSKFHMLPRYQKIVDEIISSPSQSPPLSPSNPKFKPSSPRKHKDSRLTVNSKVSKSLYVPQGYGKKDGVSTIVEIPTEAPPKLDKTYLKTLSRSERYHAKRLHKMKPSLVITELSTDFPPLPIPPRPKSPPLPRPAPKGHPKPFSLIPSELAPFRKNVNSNPYHFVRFVPEYGVQVPLLPPAGTTLMYAQYASFPSMQRCHFLRIYQDAVHILYDHLHPSEKHTFSEVEPNLVAVIEEQTYLFHEQMFGPSVVDAKLAHDSWAQYVFEHVIGFRYSGDDIPSPLLNFGSFTPHDIHAVDPLTHDLFAEFRYHHYRESLYSLPLPPFLRPEHQYGETTFTDIYSQVFHKPDAELIDSYEPKPQDSATIWNAQMFTTIRGAATGVKEFFIGDVQEDIKESTREVSALRRLLESFVLRQEDGSIPAVDHLFGIILTIYNASRASSLLDVCTIVLQAVVQTGLIKVSNVFDKLAEALETILASHSVSVITDTVISTLTAAVTIVSTLLILPLVLQACGLYSVEVEADYVAQMKTEKNSMIEWAKGFGAVKTIGQSVEYMTKWVWWVVAWIYNKITGSPLYCSEADEFLKSAKTWMETCFSIGRDHLIDSSMTVDEARRIINLENEGMTLSTHLMSIGYTHSNFTSFFKTLDEIKKIAEICRYHINHSDMRTPPLYIDFVGSPAVGKSVLMKKLLPDLDMIDQLFVLGRSDDQIVEFDYNRVFDRKFNTPFWSGYDLGKRITVIDDMWSVTTQEAFTQACDEILGMVNTAQYPLNMNQNDDKGKVDFRSSVLVTTTNQTTAVLQTRTHISDITAVLGRCDFRIEVTINPKYKVMNPIDKREQINHPDGLSVDVYNFTLLDSISYQPVKSGLVYDDILKLFAARTIKKNSPSLNVIAWARKTQKQPSFFKGLTAQMITSANPVLPVTIGQRKTKKKSDIVPPPMPPTVPLPDPADIAPDNDPIMHVKVAEAAPPPESPSISLPSTQTWIWVKLRDLAKKFSSSKPEVEPPSGKTRWVLWCTLGISVVAAVAAFWYHKQGGWHAQWGTGGSYGKFSKDNRRVRYSRGRFHDLQAHSANTKDLARSLIKNNCALLEARTSSNVSRQRATFIGGTRFHTPSHFILEYQKMLKHDGNDIVVIYTSRNPNGYEVPFSELKISIDESRDFALIQVPGIQPYPDIRSHYMKADDVDKIDFSKTLLIRPTLSRGSFLAELVESRNSYLMNSVSYKSSTLGFSLNPALGYNGDYVPGDCGCLVLLDTDFERQRIAAEHVCGDNGKGAARLITQEDLADAEYVFDAEYSAQSSDGPDFDYHDWEYEGKVADELRVPWPTKSDIVLNFSCGVLQEPTKVPARLRPYRDDEGNIVNPAQTRLDKMTVTPSYPPLDQQILEDIVQEEINHQAVCTSPARIYTHDEVINGCPHTRTIRSIDMTTSVGHLGEPPYIAKKSRYLLEKEPKTNPPQYYMSPYLEERCAKLIQDCLDKKPRVLSTVHLKDELRPIVNFAEYNADPLFVAPLPKTTRLLTAASLDHLLECKRFFGAWVENMVRHPFVFGQAIGLSPTSTDWSDLYEHLFSAGGTQELAGDVELSDCRDIPEVQACSIRICNAWYRRFDPNWKQEHDVIREYLARASMDLTSLLVIQDIVKPKRFFGTGWYLTAPFNGENYKTKHKYVLIKNAHARGIRMNAVKLRSILRYIFLGDDHLLVLPPDFGFSFKEHQRGFQQYLGVNLTTPDKASEDINEEFGSNEFCKRTPYFTTYNGIQLVKAKLPLTTIFEIMNWRSRKMDPTTAFYQNRDQVMLEMAEYDEDTWNDVNDALNSFCLDQGLALYADNYHSIMCRRLGISYPNLLYKAQMFKMSTINTPSLAVEDSNSSTFTSFANQFYHTYHRTPTLSYSSADGLWTCTLNEKYNDQKIHFVAEAATKTEARELVIEKCLERIKHIQITTPPKAKVWEAHSQMVYGPVRRLTFSRPGKAQQTFIPVPPTVDHAPDCPIYDHLIDVPLNTPQCYVRSWKFKEYTGDKDTKFQWRIGGGLTYKSIPRARQMTHKTIYGYTARMEHYTFRYKDEDLWLITFRIPPVKIEFEEVPPIGTLPPLVSPIDGEPIESNYVAQMETTPIAPEEVAGVVKSVDTVGLTTTQSDVPIAEETPRGSWKMLYDSCDPYNDPGIPNRVERQYRVATVTWSGSQPTGTRLFTLNSPYCITSQSPILLDAVQGYQFFRANTVFQAQLTMPPFFSGSLGFAYLPANNTTGTTPGNKLANIYGASTCHWNIVSAETKEMTTFTIPYVAPQPFLDTTLLGNNNGYFGTLVCYVINPLSVTNDSGTPAVQVSIFANFSNSKLAGPTFSTSTLRRRVMNRVVLNKLEEDFKHMTAHSGKVPKGKERTKKSMDRMLSGVAEDTTSTISETLSGFLPAPGSASDKFLSFGMEMLPFLGLDKPINNAATDWVMNTTTPHLADGEGLSNRHILSLKHSTRLANTPASYGSVVEERNLSSVFTKPGLFYIGTFDATAVADTVIYKWHNTPCTSYAVNQTSDGVKFVYFTPCAMIGQAYTYWHGTMKYMLHVSCSALVSCKVRIGVLPRFGDIPAIGSTISEGAGDFISQTYDVNGDTWIKFSVPYLSDSVMASCQSPYFKNEAGCAGGIFLSIVNPAVAMNSAASTTIGFSVYVAAHKDMRFERLADRPMDAVPNMNASTPGANTPIAQSSSVTKSIDEIFLEDFPSLFPSTPWDILDVTAPETYDDLYTSMHRMVCLKKWLVTGNGINTTCFKPMREYLNSDNASSLFGFMIRYFMYYRGSFDINLIPSTRYGGVTEAYVKVGLVIPSSISAYYPIQNTGEYYGQGGVAIESVDLRKGIHINVPYFSPYTYLETFPFQTPTFGTTAVTVWQDNNDPVNDTSFEVWIAPGDDFSMAWGCGAPLVSYTLAV